jgi:hypothetical protein
MVSIYCCWTTCFQWPVEQRPSDIAIHQIVNFSTVLKCFKSYKIMDMDLAIKKKTLIYLKFILGYIAHASSLFKVWCCFSMQLYNMLRLIDVNGQSRFPLWCSFKRVPEWVWIAGTAEVVWSPPPNNFHDTGRIYPFVLGLSNWHTTLLILNRSMLSWLYYHCIQGWNIFLLA